MKAVVFTDTRSVSGRDAPDLYREFDGSGAGIIKAVLHPQPD
jgi:hypothetical protein